MITQLFLFGCDMEGFWVVENKKATSAAAGWLRCLFLTPSAGIIQIRFNGSAPA